MKPVLLPVVPLMIDIFIKLEDYLMITQFPILYKYLMRNRVIGNQ
jgi:hypothetical protein